MSSAYFPTNAGSSAFQMRPVTTTTVTLTSRNRNGVETDRVERFEGVATQRQILNRFADEPDTIEFSDRSDSESEDEASFINDFRAGRAVLYTPVPPRAPTPEPEREPCYPHIHNHDNNGQRVRPYLAGCGCLDVPATPVTLPWQVPVVAGLDPASVQAVGIIHKTHTLERMRQMVPYLEGKCRLYDVTPAEVAVTLMALHNIHKGGNLSAVYSDNLRQKALSVAMEMHGATVAQDADQAIFKARQQPWTRTIEFAGEMSLIALEGTTITGTAAAATYMAGAWAGAKFASAKAAAATSAKVKAGSLAAVGAVGTAVLGGATIVAGGVTVCYWVGTITAFRDVWDNEFSRDAYFFHRLREHNTLPGDENWVQCRHRNQEWSSPLALNLVGRRGIRHN